MRTRKTRASIASMRGWGITQFLVRKQLPDTSPLLQSFSSTAATTAATPMLSAERYRTKMNQTPMKYWHIELSRTVPNGPSAHGMHVVIVSFGFAQEASLSRANKLLLASCEIDVRR